MSQKANSSQSQNGKRTPTEPTDKVDIIQPSETKDNEPITISNPSRALKNDLLKSCVGCGCLMIISVIALVVISLLWLRSLSPYLQFDDSLSGSVGEQGLSRFIDKTGADVQVEEKDLCFECPPLQVTGQKPATITISEEDVASWIQSTNKSSYGLEDLRIDITPDGISIATVVLFQGTDWPVSASGTVSKLTENSLDLEITEAQVGPLPIPEGLRRIAEERLETIMNKKLAEAPGLTINTLEFKDGEVVFDGTVPEKIGYPKVDRAVPD